MLKHSCQQQSRYSKSLYALCDKIISISFQALLIATLLCCCLPIASSPRTIYNSLDPSSLIEHLAFYSLYPESSEGEKALAHIHTLLRSDNTTVVPPLSFIENALPAFLELFSHMAPQKFLSQEQYTVIDAIASALPNRKLQGYAISSAKELDALPPDQIDLSTALLLCQYDDDQEITDHYRAMLDMMALQIRGKVVDNTSPQDILSYISEFIFSQLHFRFPSLSSYQENIDYFSSLPSVIDSRRGVCLGISVLYLCLAQRLGIPVNTTDAPYDLPGLSIITPPGHILLEYGDTTIETTARGRHYPQKTYLGISTKAIPYCTLKEVIGLSFLNKGSSELKKKEYQKARTSYERANHFYPDNTTIAELLAFTTILAGEERQGKTLLRKVVQASKPPHALIKEVTMSEDYLNGDTDIDGIAAVFLSTEPTREALLERKNMLLSAVERCPTFRMGLFALAMTSLHLTDTTDALQYLTQYHNFDNTNHCVEYYLALLHYDHHNFVRAWRHLHHAEAILNEAEFVPDCVKHLRRELAISSPEQGNHIHRIACQEEGASHPSAIDSTAGEEPEKYAK